MQFEGIPTFAPEFFCRVQQKDTMKRKQFVKGTTQIAQEGAIQIFQEIASGMEEVIVGVVGTLQFDVFKYRMENEYNVEIRMETLPYSLHPMDRHAGRGPQKAEPHVRHKKSAGHPRTLPFAFLE